MGQNENGRWEYTIKAKPAHVLALAAVLLGATGMGNLHLANGQDRNDEALKRIELQAAICHESLRQIKAELKRQAADLAELQRAIRGADGRNR